MRKLLLTLTATVCSALIVTPAAWAEKPDHAQPASKGAEQRSGAGNAASNAQKEPGSVRGAERADQRHDARDVRREERREEQEERREEREERHEARARAERAATAKEPRMHEPTKAPGRGESDQPAKQMD